MAKVYKDDEMVCITEFEKYSFSYRWTIPDFYLFKDYYTSTDSKKSTESPGFTPKHSDVKWKMSFTVQSGYNSGMCVYLTPLTEPEKPTRANIRLSILGINDKQMHTEEVVNKEVEKEKEIPLFKNKYFIDERSVTNPNNNHLVNGALTLSCRVSCRREKPISTCTPSESIPPDPPSLKLFSVTGELEKARKNSMHTDVTLVAKGKEFQAHKIILAVQSTFFKARFEQRWDRENSYVHMSDVDADILEGMLMFMYTGSTDVLKTKADKLLKAADEYGMQNLKAVCEQQLCTGPSRENFTTMLLLAETHSAKQLKQCCFDFAVRNPSVMEV